jgi:hypothetical protein
MVVVGVAIPDHFAIMVGFYEMIRSNRHLHDDGEAVGPNFNRTNVS